MNEVCENCGQSILMLCRKNTPYCCEACKEEAEE